LKPLFRTALLITAIFLLARAGPVFALFCSRDLNGDGSIDFTAEVANCTAAGSGFFCPLGAVNCGTGTMSPLCPTNGTDCVGGTYNATLKRCEAAQIVVGYRCPTSGNTYADQPTCTAACMKTANCQTGSYNVAVTANESASVWFSNGYRTYCSGNQWVIQASPNRSWTISGTTCSGDTGGSPGRAITALIPSGDVLYIYGCTSYAGDEYDGYWTGCGTLFGTLTFHNTVISGEAGRGAGAACILDDASGTSFHDSCVWETWTGLGFSGASYESCPLGSYPCNGGTCTAGAACTVVNGCPAGYQMVGNICISQPTGGAAIELDQTSHVCEAASINICPGTGFSYDAAPDLCVKNVDCEGGLLAGGLDLCIFTLSDDQCPAGFAYNAVYSACLKDAVCPGGSTLNVLHDACEIGSSSSCPDGFTLDADTNKCLAAPSCQVGTYDAAGKKCIVTASSLTPAGYAFNPASDRFEIAPPCPAGSSYSNSADQCTVDAVAACTPPGIYNAALDICESTSVPVCSIAGMTYDGVAGICFASSACPGTGATLNAVTDFCETAFTPACAGSYAWEPMRSLCELDPPCPTGSYNAARDRCEAAPTGTSCPPSYAWNPAAGKCQSAPSCSSGTYNPATDLCEQPGMPGYTCPQTGQSYATLATCNSNCITYGLCTQHSQQTGPYYCYVDGTWECDPFYGCPCIQTSTPIWFPDNGPTMFSGGPPDNGPCGPGAIHWGRGFWPFCTWYSIYYWYNTVYYWTCSLTGGTQYGSAAACSSACTQGVACTGPSYSCPGGWTISGSTCHQVAACTGGGTLNGATDLCEADGTPSCESGAYDPANGVCYSSVTCPGGGILNGTADICQTEPANSCPADYTLNAGRGICEASPQCSSGVYSPTRDRCEASSTLGCPEQGYYVWNAARNLCEADALANCTIEEFYYNEVLDQCTKAVVCPEGGVLSGLSDLCTIQMNSSKCPVGFIYDLGTDNCLKDPCSSGTYNATLDQCEDSIVANCPAGFTYSSTAGICQANPVCDGGGSYDAGVDKCAVPGSSLCPASYTFNILDARCQKTPSCDTGSSYSAALKLCTESPTRECPTTEYAYDALSRQCTAAPICYVGNFDQATNMCTGTSSTCPLGDQYECVANPTTGIMQCSSGACFDMASMPTEKTTADMRSYTNDGTVDPDGICQGTAFIFNGKPQECQSAGMSTSFFNCCDTDIGSFGPIRERCGDEDVKTVVGVKAGRCHYIGDYCKEKWPLVGCVQRANMYCCFNSKLGRIIQEQGRAQLKTLTGWGATESPDCRGLTAEEFQMIDFSRIDLSEYFGDVVTKSPSGIQREMQQKVGDFYRKTGQ